MLELGWCIEIWLGLGKLVGPSPGVLYTISSIRWFLLNYLPKASMKLPPSFARFKISIPLGFSDQLIPFGAGTRDIGEGAKFDGTISGK